MPDTPERRSTDVAPPASRTAEPVIQGSDSGHDRSTTGDTMKAEASATGEQVRQQAGRWAEDAKHRSRDMLDQQKGRAAEQIAGIARALHQSAEHCMQNEEQRSAGRMLEQAASGLDRVSDMLRSRDVDSMLDQATTLMRRQPALFIGGTVVAGFLLSRFLKSSSERGPQEYYDEAYEGREEGVSAEPTYGGGTSYVTGAHVDPGDDVPGSSRPTPPPVMPTGRRDY